jgi:hypothetical protein
MAFIPAIAAAIGSAASSAAGAIGGLTTGQALSGLGAIVSAGGTVASGVAANNAAKFESEQMRIKAAEERAAAQREAQAKRREGDLVMSRQQALAAASGAGAGTDAPTIVKLMTDTARDSEYNAQTAQYGGESRSRGLLDSAKARRASGRASLMGSVIGGFGQGAAGLGRAFG